MDEKYKNAFALKRAASAETEDMSRKMALLQDAWNEIPDPKSEWGLASATIAGMGYIEKENGNYEKAIEYFEAAVATDTRNIVHSNHFELGAIYLDHLNDTEKARNHFQKALDMSERAFQDKDPKYFIFFRGKT